MSEFKQGDFVRIKGTPSKGFIISDASKNSKKIQVDIEGKIFTVSSDKIELTEQTKVTDSKIKNINDKKKTKSVTKIPSLDLHGMTKAQAKEAVLNFISSSVISDIRIIEIIHGHGEGILKKEIERIISETSVVKSVKSPEDRRASVIVYL